MNIVVLMKQVPDTEGDRKLNPADNTVDRAAVDPVINYIDEFAIEEGLRLKEAHGGEVTILTVGPERATESIRKALSMGADKAVHVCDEALHGSDAIATAKVLAKALRHDRVGRRDRRLGGHRRPRRGRAGAARRGARRAAADPGPQGHRRRLDGHDRAGHRHRLREGRGLHAGGDQRRREDQRPALPVVQGHHGGQEQADRGQVARPTSASTPARSGWRNSLDRGRVVRERPAARGRADRQGRGRRRREDRRLPRLARS